MQHELKPRLEKDYDIEAMGKEIGTKLGLSWDQVGTKPALSWHQVEKLMSALEFPLAIKELMELLGWKDRTKFRGKYINPLIDIGVISMTIPDKPKSPNQQYYLLQKGSVLLSALKNRDSQLLKQF